MLGKLLGCVVGLVALGAGVGVVSAGSATGAGRPVPFRSCSELLAYARTNAARIAGSGGLLVPSGVPAAPAGAVGTRPAGTDVSATNVQEAGVDEPDIVKSDGSHIFAVAGNRLYAVDARAARPRLLGSLALPQGSISQLLLYKGRLLVLASAGVFPGPPVARADIFPFLPVQTVLTEVDVRDPAAMQVVRSLTVDGSYLTARQVGATARVVIASLPRIQPIEGVSPQPSRQAIASSGLQAWLPSAVLKDRRSGRTTRRALVQCRSVQRPPRFSGVGLVTILTFDLDRGLPAVDSAALMMGGGTVYASADALYVASQSWLPLPLAGPLRPQPMGIATEIDKFDTSQPGVTRYQASGTVTGFLLSQWSLSEYKGDLRVASTDQPPWWQPQPQHASETAVHVLAERGGTLVEIGRVGGLGHGERVYAVRFIAATGFVVTFRQIDPLYTLDLSDPTHPNLLGTLELHGYSAYLHPVGAGLLLGVGQDATGQGRLLGTQLTLFDISDLRRPARLDVARLGPGSSEVEYDAHAFLYWPANELAVLPVQNASTATGQFTGAIAFRVGRNGVTELGRIVHPADAAGQAGPAGAAIRRSLVVGNRLYTLSDSGIQANSLDTLTELGWVRFTE